MREKTIQVFSDEEEEFAQALIGVGTRRTVARVLVFLLNNTQDTMRAIELCTFLSQPEVSKALHYMEEQGWVVSIQEPREGIGRPKKLYSLAIPGDEILKMIGSGKKSELKNKISLLKKARTFVA